MTGILYMLLQAPWRVTGSDAASQRARELICGTLDYCISIRLASGNFPSSEVDDPDYDPNDKLVQVSVCSHEGSCCFSASMPRAHVCSCCCVAG